MTDDNRIEDGMQCEYHGKVRLQEERRNMYRKALERGGVLSITMGCLTAIIIHSSHNGIQCDVVCYRTFQVHILCSTADGDQLSMKQTVP